MLVYKFVSEGLSWTGLGSPWVSISALELWTTMLVGREDKQANKQGKRRKEHCH